MSSTTDIIDIEPDKLRRLQNLHVAFILLDVRTKAEFETAHIKGAFHLEASEFLEKIVKMVPKKDMPIVIYDADGSSTAHLVNEAEKQGFVNIVILQGGYAAFVKVSKP
jgi:rhodanese-related sulfurtransferase